MNQSSLSIRMLLTGLVLVLTACETEKDSAYFQKTIDFDKNDWGIAATLSENGEIVLCGYSNSIMVSDEVLVMKLSGTGRVSWTKSFGGPGYDAGVDIIRTSDGNYILGGNVFLKNFDIFLLKLNPYGQMIWAEHLGGQEVNNCHAVYPDQSGGCYVIGTAGNDMLFYHISNTGDTVWVKSIGKMKGYDFGRSLYVRENGNILISGNTNSFSTNQTPFVAEFNSDGNELWTSVIELANVYYIYDMTVLEQDGIYLTGGYIYDYHGFYQAFLMKTDLSGNLLWKNDLSYASFSDCFYDIEKTRDQSFILSGFVTHDTVRSQFFVTKTDLEGNRIWAKEMGKTLEDAAYQSRELDNGDILSIGTTRDPGKTTYDITVARMTKKGEIH